MQYIFRRQIFDDSRFYSGLLFIPRAGIEVQQKHRDKKLMLRHADLIARENQYLRKIRAKLGVDQAYFFSFYLDDLMVSACMPQFLLQLSLKIEYAISDSCCIKKFECIEFKAFI